MRNTLKFWAIVLVIVGTVIALFTLALFLFKTPNALNASAPIDTLVFAHYGALTSGVVGTLFSLAAFLMLLHNIEIQQETLQKQQIEGRFFELLKIHRENSNGIWLGERNGKRIFITLLREYEECFNAVQSLGPIPGFTRENAIGVAYLAFFYGATGDTTGPIVRSRVSAKYGHNVADGVISACTSRASIVQDKFRYKPFRGHQARLGHYFRHLFQTVTYIDGQPTHVLSYRAKYEYLKTLRAQFSTQEQVLLFLNSLSELGHAWERAHEEENKHLITKYNLLKNIPEGFPAIANVREFYPNIAYEGDADSAARAVLEQKYS